jgi:hypothetical protein
MVSVGQALDPFTQDPIADAKQIGSHQERTPKRGGETPTTMPGLSRPKRFDHAKPHSAWSPIVTDPAARQRVGRCPFEKGPRKPAATASDTRESSRESHHGLGTPTPKTLCLGLR